MKKYYKADSVRDTYRTLQKNPDASLIAGGQEIMLDIRHGEHNPDMLIDISEINQLNNITKTGDAIHIGACSTYNDLIESPVVRSEFTYLLDAVEDIAGPQVRKNGTVGGALCGADPVYDIPVVLLTLDASLTVQAGEQVRNIPISEFFTGRYETVLNSDEILTKITVPTLPDKSAGTYYSMTPREGDATVIGVCIRLSFSGANVCEEARIALTNADSIPKRANKAESTLEGTRVTEEDIESVVEQIKPELNLTSDKTMSKKYRKTVLYRMTDYSINNTKLKITEQI